MCASALPRIDLLSQALSRHRAGDAAGAEALYRQTLAIAPDDPNALTMLAAIERKRGNHLAARGHLERAVNAAPDRTDIHIALGDVHRVLDAITDSIAAYDRAIARTPRAPTGWLRKAELLLADEMPGAALDCLDLAPACLSDDVTFLETTGIAALRAGRYRRAADAFAAARLLAPDRADLAMKHGAASLELGRLATAAESFRIALTAGDDPAVETELALTLFAAGQMDSAWAAYAARWRVKGDPPPDAFARRPWRGETRPDMRLLICAEQGVGDQIMFAAGLPALSGAIGPTGQLVIECAAKLAPLFSRAWPDAIVEPERTSGTGPVATASYDWVAAHEPIDSVASMADLPRHLLDSFDGAPYLRADPARAGAWKTWLDKLGPGRKIGVSWRSSIANAHRDNRVPPVAAWRQLFATLPGSHFINLQYDDHAGRSWAPAIDDGGTTIHVPPELDQFDDLDGVAALMAGLDLVVSAPTAVAALAGALGRPTVRLTRGTDWSLFGRRTSPFWASLESVLLPREWYGPPAMQPAIAAARTMLARSAVTRP